MLLNGAPVRLLDSIGYGSEQQDPGRRDRVRLARRHVGCALLAPSRGPLPVCFNDAGVGKDDAGIAGLPMLDARGVPCVVYAHTSPRVGDAADGLARPHQRCERRGRRTRVAAGSRCATRSRA